MSVDWTRLARIIEGDVLLPDSPGFHRSHPVFNARFDAVRPQAIVSCASPQDVAEVLSFARRQKLEFVARSGGHSFAGHSTGQGVVIDVGPMRSVSVSDGIATVGAGARLGDVYDALQEHGLAIPAGTCPAVGVAGFTLGGGLGILGRKYGVLSDRLVAVEVVLADGRIERCDEHHDEDLFWALRGAGAGTFGIVTSFEFRTVPAPDVTNVHLAWPFSGAGDVIEGWQLWAPSGPDELAASLKVTSVGGAEPSVDLYAAYLGSAAEVAGLLEHLIDRAGADPTASSVEPLSFPETRRWWAHLGELERTPAEDDPRSVWFAARSEFFRQPAPPEAVTALLEAFGAEPASVESRELDFMPWGGAYNRARPAATAFVHREESFILKHAVTVDPGASEEQSEAATRWVSRSWGAVHPWGSGRVFQNFADPDLEPWSEAYHGSNLVRLRQVKDRYDPDDVFRLGARTTRGTASSSPGAGG